MSTHKNSTQGNADETLIAMLKKRRNILFALGGFLIYLGISTLTNAPDPREEPKPAVREAIPYSDTLLITAEFAENIDVTQGPFVSKDYYGHCRPETSAVVGTNLFALSCLHLTESKHSIDTLEMRDNRLASIDAYCRSLEEEHQRNYCFGNSLEPARSNTIIVKQALEGILSEQSRFLWAQASLNHKDAFQMISTLKEMGGEWHPKETPITQKLRGMLQYADYQRIPFHLPTIEEIAANEPVIDIDKLEQQTTKRKQKFPIHRGIGSIETLMGLLCLFLGWRVSQLLKRYEYDVADMAPVSE